MPRIERSAHSKNHVKSKFFVMQFANLGKLRHYLHMSTKTKPKPTSVHKRSAARVLVARSKTTSRKSKVLIKPLYGMDAFELMQSLGIFNAKGKPKPAYR